MGQGAKKKDQVASMFDNIAWRYDFLNHFLSFGIDKTWRKRAVQKLAGHSPGDIIDVACGTGDMSIEASRLNPERITGVDLSEKMLAKGRVKIKTRHLEDIINFRLGDSEELLFDNNTFDAAMVAFGVRNFENLEKGLEEIQRVLKGGGVLIVLEFSKPRNLFFKNIFNFYFFRILPFIGKLFSKDSSAYNYLPESVNNFPDRDEFLDVIKQAGFTETYFEELTFGIACMYFGKKRVINKINQEDIKFIK